MSLKSTTDNKNINLAVIGGGAAGLVAAIVAAKNGAAVTLFEHNSHNKTSGKAGAFVGKKLRITGKGRCNLTNFCTAEDFLKNVPVNPKFLYNAINKFSPSDTMEFFESLGVPLKIERGNRVFPTSDKSADIVAALETQLRTLGVRVVNARVVDIIASNGVVEGVIVGGKKQSFDKVILCTGGVSYKACGSTGDGYRFAQHLGHTIIAPKPSLVPLESDDEVCNECMGLALKNVGCSFVVQEKVVYDEQGEMLFTHFGVSGPVILSASAHIKQYPAVMRIDFKPALDEQKLDNRLQRDFIAAKGKLFKNALTELLPSALIAPFIQRVGIAPDKKVSDITKEERRAVLKLLKCFEINIKGTRPIDEAVITSGGVSVKEINPSTMESKLVKGLYFAGEIIDCDAYTGGFNLQIAFSTAFVAANATTKI